MHYLRYGEAEGRPPCAWFDPLWYRMVHGVPLGTSPLGTSPLGTSALEHFLLNRVEGRYMPSARLYPATRLAPWRDLPDRFDRFLEAVTVPERELTLDLSILRSSGLIGARYHAINGTPALERDLDPALHFYRFGWLSNLKPNLGFDPAWYGETNPAVTHLRINPLLHYILEGEAAGRRPVPWFDPGWYRRTHDVPGDQLALAHYLTHAAQRSVSPNPLFDLAWCQDPFLHFLTMGAIADIDPSPRFDARQWRHLHMAPLAAEGQMLLPPHDRNPLVHFLRQQYLGR